MLEFNQDDVNYIVGKCAISEQLLSHPKSQNLQNQRRDGCETSRVCVLYDIYLGKQPTLSGECGGEARL